MDGKQPGVPLAQRGHSMRVPPQVPGSSASVPARSSAGELISVGVGETVTAQPSRCSAEISGKGDESLGR